MIERFWVRNFRGVERFGCSPRGERTVIVGGNGSGKTSVVEALSLCFGVRDPLWRDVELVRRGKEGAVVECEFFDGEVKVVVGNGATAKEGGKRVTLSSLLKRKCVVMFDGEEEKLFGGKGERRRVLWKLCSVWDPDFWRFLRVYRSLVARRRAGEPRYYEEVKVGEILRERCFGFLGELRKELKKLGSEVNFVYERACARSDYAFLLKRGAETGPHRDGFRIEWRGMSGRSLSRGERKYLTASVYAAAARMFDGVLLADEPLTGLVGELRERTEGVLREVSQSVITSHEPLRGWKVCRL